MGSSVVCFSGTLWILQSVRKRLVHYYTVFDNMQIEDYMFMITISAYSGAGRGRRSLHSSWCLARQVRPFIYRTGHAATRDYSVKTVVFASLDSVAPNGSPTPEDPDISVCFLCFLSQIYAWSDLGLQTKKSIFIFYSLWNSEQD
jgi:hypothetical protein